MKIEPIPDDCFPLPDVVEAVLEGPKIGPDGKIANGLFEGWTVEEVLTDRERFRRLVGE